MATETHSLMDGKLRLYRRVGSPFWQCSTFLGGRNHRQTTKEVSLVFAKEFAREWYMERYADERRRRRSLPPFAPREELASEPVDVPRPAPKPSRKGPSFREATEAFLAETAVIIEGERSEVYMVQKQRHVRLHLLPFFGDKALTEVTAGLIQEYRVHRATSRTDRVTGQPKRPTRSTMHGETVTLRQILKTANRKGWLAALPDMSVPYKKSGKITHRAWFSPEEYKQLYQASRERAKNPTRERWRTESENLHDYILFMVNTGLRPDEALRLQYRDATAVVDEATGDRILEIEVRGKRGVGYCKSMPGAVTPLRRLKERNKAQATDLIFPTFQRELFNTLLAELNLRTDRDGQRRTAYSLRHTYICMRLMEGADIYQVAKNCRTSVEMIEKFYASHIKNTLDAAAINVRKPKPANRTASARKAANAA